MNLADVIIQYRLYTPYHLILLKEEMPNLGEIINPPATVTIYDGSTDDRAVYGLRINDDGIIDITFEPDQSRGDEPKSAYFMRTVLLKAIKLNQQMLTGAVKEGKNGWKRFDESHIFHRNTWEDNPPAGMEIKTTIVTRVQELDALKNALFKTFGNLDLKGDDNYWVPDREL